MITDTIQNALKRLFCSIGGNADNVRNKADINAILDEMTALNIGEKISGGSSGGGVLIVHEGEGRALDKTWQEIYDAGFSVLELPIPIGGKTYGVLAQIAESDGEYAVIFVTLGDSLRPQIYVANSADGYPVYTASN